MSIPTQTQITAALGLDETEFNTLIKFNPTVLDDQPPLGRYIFHRKPYEPPPPIITPKLGWANINISFGEYPQIGNPSETVYTYLANTQAGETVYSSTTNTAYGRDMFYHIQNPIARNPLEFAYGVANNAGPINWATDRVEIRPSRFDTSTFLINNLLPILDRNCNISASSPSTESQFAFTYASGDLISFWDENNNEKITHDERCYIVLLRNEQCLGYLTLDIAYFPFDTTYSSIDFVEWNEGIPPYDQGA